MAELNTLLEQILAFRKERDWEQFHNPKDLALSLVLESTEVLEHFQWKNGDEMLQYTQTHIQEIGEELADVLYWILLLSHDLGIDVTEALSHKMNKNEQKYPIKKAKGNAKKYTDL